MARALAASTAVVAYAGEAYDDPEAAVEDRESLFADFIADTRHLVEGSGVDWDVVMRRADGYHRVETAARP